MPRMGTVEQPGATVREMFGDLGYGMEKVDFSNIRKGDIIVHFLERPNGRVYGPETRQVPIEVDGGNTHKVDIHTEVVTDVEQIGPANRVHTISMPGNYSQGAAPKPLETTISGQYDYFRLVK
jgi:hypothetical protein